MRQILQQCGRLIISLSALFYYSFAMANNNESETRYLQVNDRKIPLDCTGEVETMPPYYQYELQGENAKPEGIPWVPFVDPSTWPEAVSWSESTSTSESSTLPPAVIPDLLIKPQGPPLSCKLLDSQGKMIFDYGSEVFVGRAGSNGANNHWTVYLMVNTFTVGKVPHSAGSNPESVTFIYKDKQLFFQSCEHCPD